MDSITPISFVISSADRNDQRSLPWSSALSTRYPIDRRGYPYLLPPLICALVSYQLKVTERNLEV